MIRLGHIDYSNCIPVHALLRERDQPDVRLVRDIPARLNDALAAGDIDIAPCSSIEFARHASDYTILPGLVIGSHGPVQSILLETAVPLDALHGERVAVPTASATSVVLLRALLELRLGIRPEYVWFEQGAGADPIDGGAVAALRIGDVALTRVAPQERAVYDLGAEWSTWTGLPFAFAVWQVRRDADAAGISHLAAALRESRRWFTAHDRKLAAHYAPRFGIEASRLLAYWRSLRFELDEPMQAGLLHYYRLAAELGAAPRVDALAFTELLQV
jgi:chorismate dehydratase